MCVCVCMCVHVWVRGCVSARKMEDISVDRWKIFLNTYFVEGRQVTRLVGRTQINTIGDLDAVGLPTLITKTNTH